MKIRSIELQYAPGLEQGLPKAVEVSDGLTFIVGPNASGKSTLARAIRYAYWEQKQPSPIDAHVSTIDANGRTSTLHLRGGVPRPQALNPSQDPSVARLYKLALKELLQTGNTVDQEFARKLQTELYGGIPIAEIREAIATGHTQRRTIKTALNKARNEVGKANQQSRAFENQEKRIVELQAKRQEAVEADASANALAHLLSAYDTAGEHRALQAMYQDFPDGLEHVRDDDVAQFENLHHRYDRTVEALASAKQVVKEYQAELDATDAVWHHLDEASLEVGEDLYEAYQASKKASYEARAEALRAEGNLQAARAFIFGETLRSPVSAKLKEAIKSALEDHRAAQRHAEALAAWRDSIIVEEGADTESPKRLWSQIQHLRAWLTHPTHEGRAQGARPWAIVAALALLNFVCVIRFFTLASEHDDTNYLPSAFWAAFFGLIGVLACIWYLFSAHVAQRDALKESERLKDEVTRSGISLSSWARASVQNELERCEEALALQQRAEKSRETKSAYHQQWLEAQKTADERANDLQALAQDAGIQPDLLTAEIAEAFARTEKWLDSEEQHANAVARRRSADMAHERCQNDWESWLERHDLTHHAQELGQDALVSYASKRIRRVNAVRESLGHEAKELSRQEAALRDTQSALDQFHERLGAWAESASAIREALEIRKEWSKVYEDLRAEERELTRVLKLLETHQVALQKVPVIAGAELNWPLTEEDILSFDAQALMEAQHAFEDIAAKSDAILEEITSLKTTLELAADGHAIEDAYAAYERARTESMAFAEQRADAFLDTMMLDWSVAATAEQSATSGANTTLQQANFWLTQFTHGAYELRVDSNGELVGYAVKEGAERPLAALSDATRVQALLAARLAAIHDAEADGPEPPLVLDEVFSTTDPHRFEAIGRALSALVANGRQVIYLTADPMEWHRWEALQAADANLVRAQVHYIRPEALSVHAPIDISPMSVIAKPRGNDPQQWAKALNIPQASLRTSSRAWPLLWLLSDELDAVYAAYKLRVTEAGPALSYARGPQASMLWGCPAADAEALTARLQRRVRVVDGVVTRWQQGQPGVVRWEHVDASGAVTENFRDAVMELLEQHAANPITFVEAVGALPRFHQAKRRDLEDYLRDIRVIPDVAPASREELVDLATALVVSQADADAHDIAWCNHLLHTLVEDVLTPPALIEAS